MLNSTGSMAGARTRSFRPVALCILTVFLAAALTACAGGGSGGTGEGKKSDVASLASGDPAKTATGPADADRPQLRLDTSDEERNRLWRSYRICLKEHGVKPNTGAGPATQSGERSDLDLDTSGEPKEAYVACAKKLPLQPPELDPDKNPNYVDQWNENVQCLRRRGMKVHALPNGEGWSYDEGAEQTLSENERRVVEKECLMEVFGGKRK